MRTWTAFVTFISWFGRLRQTCIYRLSHCLVLQDIRSDFVVEVVYPRATVRSREHLEPKNLALLRTEYSVVTWPLSSITSQCNVTCAAFSETCTDGSTDILFGGNPMDLGS